MKRIASLTIALLLILVMSVGATVTTSTVTTVDVKDRDMQVITWTWASAEDGKATSSLTGVHVAYAQGVIEKVVFPYGDDPTTPTTLYDVEIFDVDGCDVLLGKGMNRSISMPASIVFDPVILESQSILLPTGDSPYTGKVTFYPYRTVVKGRLHLRVTNAGDQKKGKVRMYVRRYLVSGEY